MQEQSQPEDQDTYDELEYDEHYTETQKEEKQYREYTSAAYKELIADVANVSGYYKYQVKDILDSLTYAIANRMVDGKKSKIDNLGTFELRIHPARVINIPIINGSKTTRRHLTDTIVQCKFVVAPILKAVMQEKQREKEFQEALQYQDPDEMI